MLSLTGLPRAGEWVPRGLKPRGGPWTARPQSRARPEGRQLLVTSLGSCCRCPPPALLAPPPQPYSHILEGKAHTPEPPERGCAWGLCGPGHPVRPCCSWGSCWAPRPSSPVPGTPTAAATGAVTSASQVSGPATEQGRGTCVDDTGPGDSGDRGVRLGSGCWAVGQTDLGCPAPPPAGYEMKRRCTDSDRDSTCSPCRPGFYNEYHNYDTCKRCTQCNHSEHPASPVPIRDKPQTTEGLTLPGGPGTPPSSQGAQPTWARREHMTATWPVGLTEGPAAFWARPEAPGAVPGAMWPGGARCPGLGENQELPGRRVLPARGR